MKEQTWIIENMNSFEPVHIFECGQCFRWNKEQDGSYMGVFKKSVINVKKEGDKVLFTGVCEDNIQEVCQEYFDLDRDYEKIKQELSKIDENMMTSIGYGQGIRILNQDLWETLLSFIISANNNIPRIKGIIERLAQNYGEKLRYRKKEYYLFPTPEQLAKASVEDLRRLGLGFRDKRVFETTKMVVTKELDLQKLQEEKETQRIRNRLLEVPGVGPKVADCILLFSLKRLEAFPIDVWVRRVMNELYIKHKEEKKVSNKQIEELARKKYGNLAGIAQQYLFYWKREVG